LSREHTISFVFPCGGYQSLLWSVSNI